MSYTSQILINEIEKDSKEKEKNDKDLEIKRNNYSKEIKIKQKNIEKCLNRIREYHENKRKVISKIRTIMETSSNHVNDLICKKLKENKEGEYKNELANLNYLIRTDITKNEEYQILKERKLIEDIKENYKNYESLSIGLIDKAIERGRKEILIQSIKFLEENKRNRDHIYVLKRMLKELNEEK